MNPLILRGDARKIPLPDGSVSAIVTDPPYELTGKSGKGGFMQKRWDGTGVSFDPSTWAESLRVLKPGGHLLAFGGTRTMHRIAVAIEDAGFEIRDSIMWIYGTGFTKSLDISKAIDKMAGAERKVVGKKGGRYAAGFSDAARDHFRGMGGTGMTGDASKIGDITEPATDDARKWQGWGTSLKPSHEPVIIARKPFAGNVASNVLAYGTGGINVDAGRIETIGQRKLIDATANVIPSEYGTMQGSRAVGSTDLGRWPPNTALQHNSDCRLVGVRRVETGKYVGHNRDGSEIASRIAGPKYKDTVDATHADPDGLETVEVWECSDGCPVKQIDIQSVKLTSGKAASGGHRRKASLGDVESGWAMRGDADAGTLYGDSGGASRFFPRFAWDADDWFPFLYTSKSSRAERNQGLEGLPTGSTPNKFSGDEGFSGRTRGPSGEWVNTNTPRHPTANTHPTCKPVRFMEWLIRLVMPPDGVLLDPFAGSGSTLVAAVRCGVTAIGMDNDREHGYHAIQAARVRHAVEHARPPRSVPDGVLPIPEIRPTRKGRKRKHADGPTLFD